MTPFTLGEATTIALGRMTRQGPRPVMRSFGRASQRLPHRTGAPVRRDSLEAGTFEEMFFATPAKGECDRMVRAARAALDAGRHAKRLARAEDRDLTPTEALLARLTAGAVRVFEEVCTLARLNRGRVFPSYDRLAAATALGRATVARALVALEATGFLVRQRRFRRVEGQGAGAEAGAAGADKAGQGGPRYAQTSNVYRPLLPVRLLDHLPRWLRPAPVPVDALQHAKARDEAVRAMEAGLSAGDRAQIQVGGALGRMLARLGAAIDARSDAVSCESHLDPQPLVHINIDRAKRDGLDGRHTWPNGQAPADEANHNNRQHENRWKKRRLCRRNAP